MKEEKGRANKHIGSHKRVKFINKLFLVVESFLTSWPCCWHGDRMLPSARHINVK